jgi:hypothetical protein
LVKPEGQLIRIYLKKELANSTNGSKQQQEAIYLGK